MMISPEMYAEVYLNGKTIQETEKQIRKLKREISHLKNTLEHPVENEETMLIFPSPSVQLQMCELYLEESKKKLKEIGGEYLPTATEIRQEKTKERLKHIKTFTFSIGGFHQGNVTHVIEINDTLSYRNETFPDCNFVTDEMHRYSKENFFEMVENARIEEWKHYYFAPVMDGEQWEIKIEFYDDKKPLEYYGSNAYPFSFEWVRNFFEGEIEFDE